MSRVGSISTLFVVVAAVARLSDAASEHHASRHRGVCCDGADVNPSWLTLAPFNLIFIYLI
jgi:hypothetical protein